MDTPSGWRIQVRLEMGGSLGEGSGKTGGRDCEGWKEVSFPKAKETRGKTGNQSSTFAVAVAVAVAVLPDCEPPISFGDSDSEGWRIQVRLAPVTATENRR